MNRKNKKRLNSEATQNENDQFAGAFFESENEYDLPRYPERKNIELPTENDDAGYAFHWEPVYAEEEKPQKKEKSKNSEPTPQKATASQATSPTPQKAKQNTSSPK